MSDWFFMLGEPLASGEREQDRGGDECHAAMADGMTTQFRRAHRPVR